MRSNNRAHEHPFSLHDRSPQYRVININRHYFEWYWRIWEWRLQHASQPGFYGRNPNCCSVIMKPSRLFNIAVAIDLLLAAIVGCKRNETLSAAAFSTEKNGKFWGRFWRPKIDALFRRGQPDHCRIQYELEAQWNRTFNE